MMGKTVKVSEQVYEELYRRAGKLEGVSVREKNPNTVLEKLLFGENREVK